jgi:hypothetical protein
MPRIARYRIAPSHPQIAKRCTQDTVPVVHVNQLRLERETLQPGDVQRALGRNSERRRTALRLCEHMPCHSVQGNHSANQAIEQEEQHKCDGEQRDAGELVK